jgi:hypothetical protein
VVAARNAKTKQLVLSTERLRNVAKKTVEEKGDACSAAMKAAAQNIGVLADEPRTEVLQAEVRRSVGGCGGSTRIAEPEVHASIRGPLGEGGHGSEADPARRLIELQPQ